MSFINKFYNLYDLYNVTSCPIRHIFAPHVSEVHGRSEIWSPKFRLFRNDPMIKKYIKWSL